MYIQYVYIKGAGFITDIWRGICRSELYIDYKYVHIYIWDLVLMARFLSNKEGRKVSSDVVHQQ